MAESPGHSSIGPLVPLPMENWRDSGKSSASPRQTKPCNAGAAANHLRWSRRRRCSNNNQPSYLRSSILDISPPSCEYPGGSAPHVLRSGHRDFQGNGLDGCGVKASSRTSSRRPDDAEWVGDPPTRETDALINVTGTDRCGDVWGEDYVQQWVAGSDQNRVILTEVDRTLTGEYQCEVSADAPLFHTDIKSAEMVVVEPPLMGPNVTSDRMTYVGGDHIRANCSSPPSLPAANITWYVNEQMVPGFTANHVNNFSNGYASSLATLELEAALLSPVPTLMIRCEASIFDVWKATSHTIVLRERSASPASALGRSFTGAAAETCIPTILVVLLQILLQFLLGSYTETSIR
ncbi:unnamed protein product [Diatraea saccharalis]|uniref:Ig-like domain-containing protein n=1 Tax=Diatraea saccharalis TaxID=40085 RepID=A0A9N9WGX0_9NEOP|nr:unnamed protein product [Diatraea saccharalis]